MKEQRKLGRNVEKAKNKILVYSVKSNKCWNWFGASCGKKRAYGQVFWNGHMWMAHRLSYEAFVGKIPKGLQVDHLCRNRKCVNPKHLEPVTPEENVRREAKFRKRQVYCKRGHKLIENGYPRRCVVCRKSYKVGNPKGEKLVKLNNLRQKYGLPKL